MGIKSDQGELNVALKPLFAHIPKAHLIHNDLVIATLDMKEHIEVLTEIMIAISRAELTLQSNAEFIKDFSRKPSLLRELTKGSKKFIWEKKHEDSFYSLLMEFRKDTLLRYFDINKPTFIFVDAHVSGLGAILAQGEDILSAKPIAFASRTTNLAETRYPQLDIEAMSVDFGLRRFRNYIVGAPAEINIVTDHKPLCSVFNGKRQGSIRTERIKMRHQDIRYRNFFQKGEHNQTDYLSRNAK